MFDKGQKQSSTLSCDSSNFSNEGALFYLIRASAHWGLEKKMVCICHLFPVTQPMFEH